MSWTDERVELLKKMWADGLSALEIAKELGGVSRNGVIGKINRLGLSHDDQIKQPRTNRPRRAVSRATGPDPRTLGRQVITSLFNNSAQRVAASGKPPQRVSPPVADLGDAVVPLPLRATILTLTDSVCHWPIGDPQKEDFCFCGHDHRAGSPYCDYHSRIAYEPISDRRRDHRLLEQ